MTNKKKKKVLVIGWDAADWKVIHPLMDKGLMPNLEKLVNNGTMGKLATLDPPLSPMLWTSIATGKRPYSHGIMGFTEPKPDGSGIQPVLNTSRKCRAIWNILNHEGYKTNVIGWWPSHPAEPVDGVYISNFYQKANLPKEGEVLKPWPLMPNTVHPKELTNIYAKLRVHPYELTVNHLQPFMPNGKDVDQEDEGVRKYINSLRKIIADAASIHSAATYAMETTDWDFMGVYYDAIDHFGHGFMKFNPPRRDFIPENLYNAFYYVTEAGYRYHDMLLGKLMKLAGPDANILLISDHGFHPDNLRPKGLDRSIPAAAAKEHSPYGIIVASGPDFKKDHLVHGSSLIDITPTILHLYDLPVGEDMDGRVLKDMFAIKKEIKSIDSWENVEGNFNTHDPSMITDSNIDQETIDQLVELGYIEKPDDNAQVAIKNTVDESKYWETLAYVDAKLYHEALEIIYPLWDEYKEDDTKSRYAMLLIKVYRNTGQGDKAREVLVALRKLMDGKNVYADMLEARFLNMEGKYKEAIEILLKVETNSQDSPEFYLQLGNAYTRAKDFGAAERSFNKVLKLDSQNANAFYGLGYQYYLEKLYEKSAQYFIESIALQYDQPYAHYHLGECLLKLGDEQGAAKAFSVALSMDEGINKARKHLLDQKENNSLDEEIVVDENYQFKKEVIVVSGLPRSGTSMMMQILHNHGYDIFTDNKRKADENNIKGYFEHEGIKKLASNKHILELIKDGQAVKIVAPLLGYLAIKTKYHVIFMDRDLEEIINSQSSMLKRMQDEGEETKADRDKNKLKKSYEGLLKGVANMPKNRIGIELSYIKHRDCFENPSLVATQLNHSLSTNKFTAEGISEIVDPVLYREK